MSKKVNITVKRNIKDYNYGESTSQSQTRRMVRQSRRRQNRRVFRNEVIYNKNNIMRREDRTVDDLSEEEYEDYQNNPDDPKWQQVTDNTNDMYRNMMFPDGEDD